MPFNVGRYPLGLLELLGSKANGTTPSLVADIIQPVVDTTEFFAQSVNRLVGTSIAPIGAIGFAPAGPLVLVPEGELWRVRHFSVYRTAALAALTTYRFSPAVRNTADVTQIMVSPSVQSFTAGEQPSLGWDIPGHWLVPAGWHFGIFVQNVILGAAASFNVMLDYDRLTQ